jgi:hypothetical protein
MAHGVGIFAAVLKNAVVIVFAGALFSGAAGAQTARKPLIQVDDLQFTKLGDQGDAMTFRAMLEASLVSAGRFEVISNSQSVMDAGAVQRAGRPANNRPQARRPDYLIGGVVNAESQIRNDMGARMLCAATVGEQFYVPGMKLTITADITVTEIATNSIKRAPRTIKTIIEPARCGIDKKLDGNVALRKTADEVALLTTTAIYPLAVVRISATNQLVLNYGGSVLAAGQYLRIYGDEIRTPDPASPGGVNISRDAVGYAVVVETQQSSATADAKGVGLELIKPGMVLELTDPVPARAAIQAWERANRRRR